MLNYQLCIEQIRAIAVDVINKYNKAQDVIWVYVARTGEDYIVSNWILRGSGLAPNWMRNIVHLH